MNDYNIITLRLGESDGDIICWINSLPPYTFRKYINAIIISESQQTIEQVPCDYNCIEDIEKTSYTIRIKDQRAINFIERIPKGKINSTILRVIRKHLRKSMKMREELVGINKKIYNIVNNGFMREMELKKREYRFARNKQEKLKKAYYLGKQEFMDAVFRCYKFVDSNTGDYNLKYLDYRTIVAEAYEMSFGYVLPKLIRKILRKV